MIDTGIKCENCKKANLVRFNSSVVNNDWGWCPHCGLLRNTFETIEPSHIPRIYTANQAAS